ncbi:DNA replication initiation factor cdc45 [Coemansia sp. Benny D115]|nr:DNA replication initiation factor cdc45 [Coemansia sp. Benny D115]
MVFVSSTRYEDAYRRLSTSAEHNGYGSTSILIFASTDVDSLCALRILTGLLKRDALGHKIVPVSSYTEIQQLAAKHLVEGTQIRSVVFLNCGGSVDIQDYVELRPELTVLIIDSHRPLNLYNIYWNDQVQCLDDGEVERDMQEVQKAFEDIEFNDGASDDSSDSDGDSDAEPGHRRRKLGADPDDFVRVQRERAEKRQTRALHRQRIQAYYAQEAYHGQSCAISMLQMAEQLGQPATLDTVWYALTGAATQQLLQLADSEACAQTVKRMRDTVRRVSIVSAGTGAGAADEGAGAGAGAGEVEFDPHVVVRDEDDDEAFIMAQQGAHTPAEAGLLVSSRRSGPQRSIEESVELPFALLRHWSLDSAMRYSPFVATRLATWSSRGRARLALLLAKLGLSRAEAQMPFQHLAPELKEQLHRRMREIGGDYDMGPDDGAQRPGFVRNYGWRKPRCSATDCAMALVALLQAEGFYAAYDALEQVAVLQRGLQLAQQLQQQVIGQGLAMLERQAVKTLRAFRLAVIADNDAQSTFLGADALRQLALFLMQTLREHGSRSRKGRAADLPFVIASPVSAEQPDRLLVLGVRPAREHRGEEQARFGAVFDEVAAGLGADVRTGFFDAAAMEIGRADMAAFVDRLRRQL